MTVKAIISILSLSQPATSMVSPIPLIHSALKKYMQATHQAANNHLFMWPTSLSPYTKKPNAEVVRKVTDSVDLGKYLATQDVHRCEASLNYLWRYSEDHTWHSEQWSSSFSS